MEKTFEESIIELEKIVSDLESGDMNLDESMKKFEEGMKMSKYCSELLEGAEKKITMILEKNGELVEEDYLMTQKVMNYPETSFTVEEGTVFCMGDNRNVSKDSRNVGPIPIYQILGKVWKM